MDLCHTGGRKRLLVGKGHVDDWNSVGSDWRCGMLQNVSLSRLKLVQRIR